MFLNNEKEKLLQQLLSEEFSICLEKARQMTIFEFVNFNLVKINSDYFVTKEVFYTRIHGIKYYWDKETGQFVGWSIE